MAEIIELADNIIGTQDQQRIESFAAHEISHGRATRYHWDTNEQNDPVFELYRGGVDEVLVVRITHNRNDHEFQVHNRYDRLIIAGKLEEIMAELDEKLIREHEDESPTSA